VDHDTAQNWLDRYVAAWKSYDTAEIAALFSAGVRSRFYPYAARIARRDAVVPGSLAQGPDAQGSTRDEPGTYDAHYAPVAVDGDVVVATGTTTYTETPGGPVTQVFDNCFVMRFDGRARCREFTEYYTKRP
jgi:hypothetical protein